MIQSKFKIGDKVKVTDSGCIYSYYDEMAGMMDLKNWQPGKGIKNGSVATVIQIERHPEDLSTILIGIRLEDGTEHIISEEGLELLTEIKPSDTIQICRTRLDDYYNASTPAQKQYINDNFKVDGTTTVDAIIGLEAIACDDWKRIIRRNHPECFSKTEFDFSEYVKKFDTNIISEEQYKLLGFRCSPIQIRSGGEYNHKGFYLTSKVKWKLVEDQGAQILVPIKK